MNKKNNNKGFTLAELLIVVAIIAVLVAIAIPVFTAQLEKSREATDQANLRAIYAECVSAALTETTAGTTESGVTVTVDTGVVTASKSYTTKQAVAGWSGEAPVIGDLTMTASEAPAKGSITVKATSTGHVEIGSVKNYTP